MVGSGPVLLEGTLSVPAGARALAVFAYDRMVNSERLLGILDALAEAHRQAGLATLSVNLLRPEDEELDNATGFFRENVGDWTLWLGHPGDARGLIHPFL